MSPPTADSETGGDEVEPIHSHDETNTLYDLAITLDALSADADRVIIILCFTLQLNGAISIPTLSKANKRVYFYTKTCDTSLEGPKEPWRIRLD